jgi:adenosylmethionine-8-amino-7-oxononanoate aminotransferase
VAVATTSVLRPELDRTYPLVERGEGVFLYDESGRRYLDAASGAVVANIGHGVEAIAAAMADQARRVAFSYRTQFSSRPLEELARRIAAIAPGDLEFSVFTNSGSEATEAALRLALQYWREVGRPEKTHVVSRHMSYHGMTLGALSMSGHPGRRAGLEPLLHQFPAVPPAYCYRCPLGLSPDTCATRCAEEWETAFVAAGPETVAAAIVEPVVGAAGGAVPAPDGYLARLREICDRHEVLLIADEIITGFGRTGTWFGCDHDGVVPDLLVVGKGISAGYVPVAAVIARRHVVDAIERGSGVGVFSHTYSGFPLGAATCLAVLDYLDEHDLVTAARDRGAELRAGLEAVAARHPIVGDVRGRGLLLGLELVADPRTKRRFPVEAQVARRLVDLSFERGLILYPAGTPPAGDAVLVTPPLTISRAEIGELLELLDAALTELELELAARLAGAVTDGPAAPGSATDHALERTADRA